MACCLMAPSHYLNQFWLVISRLLFHSTNFGKILFTLQTAMSAWITWRHVWRSFSNQERNYTKKKKPSGRCMTRWDVSTRSLQMSSNYRQNSNISGTLLGDEIVDHSDSNVVGASPVGVAPTTSSFSTLHLASVDWAKATAREANHLSIRIWCDLY